MKLTISIEMENDAFDLDTRYDEIARILNHFIEDADTAEMLLHGGKVKLLDVNGNSCGYARAAE